MDLSSPFTLCPILFPAAIKTNWKYSSKRFLQNWSNAFAQKAPASFLHNPTMSFLCDLKDKVLMSLRGRD